MAIKYKFVRMPVKTYEEYIRIQAQMVKDLKTITGKNIKLPMTKVFKAVASPSLNENYIKIDLQKLKRLAQK